MLDSKKAEAAAANPRKRSELPVALSQRPTKIAKVGNWRDSFSVDKKIKPPEPPHPHPNLPQAKTVDALISETFSLGRPMEDVPDLHACKHCKKAVLGPALLPHIARCLQVKKEKAQRKKVAREARERAREAAREEEARKAEEDGDGKANETDGDGKKVAGKTSKKAAGKKLDGDNKGKKRKADDIADKAHKSKKKKEEPKPKVPKPKGPVDVERHCGVLLANGQSCARSLTCKSHSMGAKRAVPGRSMPYNLLLAAYQKKNQAKQQKAALDANAPLEDEEESNNGPIDEEEEAHLVKTALKNWRPTPVVVDKTFAPLKFEYKHARLRELLDNATNGGRTNIFKVNGFGAQKLTEGHPGVLPLEEDAPGEPDVVPMPSPAMNNARRSSSISMQPPGQQHRPSVTAESLSQRAGITTSNATTPTIGQRGMEKARYFADLILQISRDAAAQRLDADAFVERLLVDGYEGYLTRDIRKVELWLTLERKKSRGKPPQRDEFIPDGACSTALGMDMPMLEDFITRNDLGFLPSIAIECVQGLCLSLAGRLPHKTPGCIRSHMRKLYPAARQLGVAPMEILLLSAWMKTSVLDILARLQPLPQEARFELLEEPNSHLRRYAKCSARGRRADLTQDGDEDQDQDGLARERDG
ncbi:SAGA-associated factor 73 [Zalerion maritima]|uniref:SAGA-associated factor 73 n=1 Tax=Zalerion maritima TaxID=339359 RepID=A0AAD5WR72_9PEZI|nr:SAGA-associated factor 73 [Zalerion maritima]